MISSLVTTRLLSNLVRFSRHTTSLGRNHKKLFISECRIIRNLSALSMRSVAISPQEKEEDQTNFRDQIQKEVDQLGQDARTRRVFKENINNVFQNLKELGEMTSDQLNILLKCCTRISFMCAEKERVRMAEEFWSTAEKMNVKFDIKNFNELLNVYVANSHKFSYEDYLKKMEKEGVKPDILTFRYLLRATCQVGDIDAAKNLLEKMKSMKIPIDTLDFNSLILAYSKIGDFEKVNEILNIMKSKGLRPTAKSYVYLLCGYIKHEKLKEFENRFNELFRSRDALLSNWDLLEIVYALAVKNQNGYIDMVMNEMGGTADHDFQISTCVQRLLHKKLDSTALQLVDRIDVSGRSFDFALGIAKNILDHYVWYRTPREVIEICKKLEEKGLARTPVSYCLKKVFFCRDIKFFEHFLSQMRSEGLAIRPHYYWPLIVQEAKKGNEALLSSLKKTPVHVLENPFLTYNLVLPNYTFSENWKEDLDKLTESGLNKFYTARCLLNSLLEKENLDEAEKLVSTQPLDISRMRKIFNYLTSALKKKEEAVDQVINIMYCLYHDVYLFTDFFQNMKDFAYFDEIIYSLLKYVKKKELVVRVLQAMLDKKMGISSKACNEIIQNFPDEDVKDLTTKLSDPNLKVELDQSLLAKKSNAVGKESEMTLRDCVESMLSLTEDRKFKRAFGLGLKFAEKKKVIPKKEIEESEDIYRRYLTKLTYLDKENNIKDSINLGIRLGFLKENDTHNDFFLLRNALQSNYTTKAFEIFKEMLLTTREPVLCQALLIKCIANGETDKVQKITKLVTYTLNRNAALTYLVCALTELGEFEKAKKVLATPDFVFQKDLILKSINTRTFATNLLEVLKDVDIDKTEMYKILVKEHAMKNDVKEIEKFWSEVPRKDISDGAFLDAMAEFEMNKNCDSLCKSIEIRLPRSRLSKWLSLKRPGKKAALEEQYITAMSGTLTPGEVSNLAKNFAFLGDADKACGLLENYSITKSIRNIASAFLTSCNHDKYFKFLDFFASKGDFIALNNCFLVGGIISVLQNNENLYKKYKSLLHQCASETNFTNPIVLSFVISAKIPGKVSDAEEIIEKYSERIKNVPFSTISDVVEMSERSETFYETVLSSEKLKNFFSQNLDELYNKLITFKYEGNDKKEALKYIQKAEDDKVRNKLDEELLAKVDPKLKQVKKEEVKQTENVTSNIN